MNNWINRLAIFAVVGAILSSAVLVGCGGNSADTATDANATNGAGAMAPAKPAADEGG